MTMVLSTVRFKRCTKCRCTKPFWMFSKSKRGFGGKDSRCKVCKTRYRENNKERIAETGRIWRENNKERITETIRLWNENNKEHIIETGRVYRAENSERCAEQRRLWRLNNPEMVRASRRRRRALIAGAEGTHSPKDIVFIYDNQNGLCYYCLRDVSNGYHVDHKMPLSRGGTDWPDNICLACSDCNDLKGSKTPEEFEEYKASIEGIGV